MQDCTTIFLITWFLGDVVHHLHPVWDIGTTIWSIDREEGEAKIFRWLIVLMLCHCLGLRSSLAGTRMLQSIWASIRRRWYQSDYHGGLCLWHRLNPVARTKVNISSKFWPECSFKQNKRKLFSIFQTMFNLSTSTWGFPRQHIDFFLFLKLIDAEALIKDLTLIKVTCSDLLHHWAWFRDSKTSLSDFRSNPLN